jgi:HD-GYP domain-containing protein (c-di-GMP phosphodiesterase class II)
MILRRIVTIVVIVLIVTIGLTSFISLRVQSRRLMDAKVADASVLNDIILASIESSMAQGKTEDVQRSLESIGRNPEIVNLRIVSPEGYILKSKDPAEIGLKSREFALFRSRAEAGETIADEKAVTRFTTVANRRDCYGCHSSTQAINGLIEVKYDLSRSRADLLAIKRFLILSNILTVLLVVGILSALYVKYLVSPLGSFLDTIRAIEGGNLDARIANQGNDEFGRIGVAFNSMLDEVRKLYDRNIRREKEIARVKVELDHKVMLEELNAQLQYKVREVETSNKAVLSLSKEVKSKNIELEKMVERLKRINEVGRLLTSIINLDELLSLIIKTTSEMMRVEKGSIYLRKNNGRTLYMEYQKDVGIERSADVNVDVNPLYGGMIAEGRPLLINAGAGSPVSAIGVPLKMKGQIIGGVLLEMPTEGRNFGADELELLGTMANQAMVSIENAWLYETVKSNYFGTIQALVNALEASDRYTKGHSERVRLLGVELSRHIGLDYREVELFEQAAILHDIGKIGIDAAVLNKEDKLTTTEFSLIRAHPIIGDEILGPIGTLQSVRTTILQHHEKYDGTGYPYGIAGDEITLKARILSVVDTFDAMMTDRPYRKGLPMTVALDELRRGSGTQFDPLVVGSFLEMIDQNEHLLVEAGYSMN